MNKRETLMGIKVNNLTGCQALAAADQFMQTREDAYVVFVNADVRVKMERDAYLKRISDEADLTLVDGMPLVWAAKWYGRHIEERIAGSDWVPSLCALAAKRGYSVFLLGGAEGVTEKAAENLKKRYPALKICGVYSPPYHFEKDKEKSKQVCKRVAAADPDILIVCLGCPKQEKFIYEHRKEYHARLSVCAGATVDFLAETLRRCPPLLGKLGLEWFFRFLMEPRRLFKRYFIDDMYIFWLTWKYRPNKRRCGK